MKTKDLVLLGALGLGAFLLLKPTQKTEATNPLDQALSAMQGLSGANNPLFIPYQIGNQIAGVAANAAGRELNYLQQGVSTLAAGTANILAPQTPTAQVTPQKSSFSGTGGGSVWVSGSAASRLGPSIGVKAILNSAGSVAGYETGKQSVLASSTQGQLITARLGGLALIASTTPAKSSSTFSNAFSKVSGKVF